MPIEKNCKQFPVLKDVTKVLDWKDIGHEIYRVYIFSDDGKIVKLKIDEPALINISASGGHRILTKYNVSHYIPYKWLCFYYETDDEVAWRF